jgi:hypothetical protein
MPGMRDFVTEVSAFRQIIVKAAAYTAVLTDELIKVNGAYTLTLPPLNSLQGTLYHKKIFVIQNIGTNTNVTVQPGTNTVTNTADTIASKATWTILPNETIEIVGREVDTNWIISNIYPMPSTQRATWTRTVTTNGTTVVNVFGADGAPANILIENILVIPQDATSKNITLIGAASTIATVVCSTSAAGTVIGSTTALTYPAVASGSTLTVASSATNGQALVLVSGTVQNYA